MEQQQIEHTHSNTPETRRDPEPLRLPKIDRLIERTGNGRYQVQDVDGVSMVVFTFEGRERTAPDSKNPRRASRTWRVLVHAGAPKQAIEAAIIDQWNYGGGKALIRHD